MQTLKIDVAADLSGLSPAAMNMLNSEVARFAEDVVQQAAREEEARRTPGSTVAEITEGHVIEATRAVRGLSRIPRRPTRREATIVVVAALSTGSAGVFAQMLNSIWEGIAFGASVGVAIISTWIAARSPR